ncbi:MAG: hypothetical protein Rubg2KO_01610 [Rubricoccaceae bacterium]
MTPDRWNAIEALFDEAAHLPPADRPAFLEAACRQPDGAPDPGLREEVERLLALDDGAETFFGDLREDLQPASASAMPPPEAGPWRLVERVGEGGMGEVWRAERADGSYAQTAAVKLVRPGLGADLLARFRAERHVLARLDHPAIARLLDGGTASDGRPYLALEYVDGEPITMYADQRRLSVNERLVLFQDVCAAVAAAHRQLVVHRDLKPSNVLVTTDGQVKLLDFGIAKLLDDEADFTVAETGADRRVMTPEYAAPEQVRGEPLTTATDVYGLGVLLYELLTGTRPYQLQSRVRRAIELAILETEPTDPSTAVTGASEAAEARATEPARLKRRLRGDLDQIVLKALRKAPERRYDGAATLAADLKRHLDGLPVEARPESTAYRVGRFVRRHKVGVGAAAAVLVAVLAGAGVALWQAAEARTQAQRATEVSDFMVTLFTSANPSEARGDTLTAFDLLDRGIERADTLEEQPEVQAQMLRVLGRTSTALGDYARADTLLDRALAVQRRVYGRRHPEIAQTLEEQAQVARLTGDTDRAIALIREGLENAGDDDDVRANLLIGIGVALQIQADYDGAEAAIQDALELDPSPFRSADALVQLSSALGAAGEYERAQSLLEEAIPTLTRVVGADHPTTIEAQFNLGNVLRISGDPAGAEPLYREVLAARQEIYGPDHDQVSATKLSLGMTLSDQETPETLAEAGDILRDALATLDRRHPDGYPLIGTAVYALAGVESELDQLDAAETLYRRAVALDRAELGEHPYTALTLNALGIVLRKKGELAEAEASIREALAMQQAVLPPGHLDILSSQGNLGDVLREAERYAAAERLYLDAAEGLEVEMPEGHPDRQRARQRLVTLYEAWGRPDEAARWRDAS